MLMSMKPILDAAKEGHYGVIAPSIDAEPCIEAAIEAAEELRSPVILNIHSYTFDDMDLMIHLARTRAERASVPVAINEDHGEAYEDAIQCIHWGFTSIMPDRSKLPFEENVAQVKELVKIAHAAGVSVEAELGHVGLASDSLDLSGTTGSAGVERGLFSIDSTYTDPDLAVKFVELTGVDALAVSIGNKHGAFPKGVKPEINFDLLQELSEKVPVPLVLHGGSGTGDENLRKACQMGICKINVGTELRRGAANKILNLPEGKYPWTYDLVKQGYKEGILYHMNLFGSSGKAK